MFDAGIPQFQLFELFEMTPALVCITGRDGFFKKVNPAFIDKLGYTEAELLESPVSSFIYPEDRDLTRTERVKLLQGTPLLNFQNRYLTKEGTVIWLEWTSIYSSRQEIVFAIAKDISARKQGEKEIEEKYAKFKSLAAHFKTSIEKDRKYLAVELHEELAQLAAVVKIDLDWINVHEQGLSRNSKEKIMHAMRISDLLLNTIRRISFSISPNMLEDIGLNETLKWHCKEFEKLNGIPCLFESSYDEESLVQEVKLDFFRICQESLNNVMDHALASNVKIKIADAGDKISLSIVDDGKGFDIAKQNKSPGITSMHKRATSVNGELTIQSEPGKGTRVCVIIAK